jgi:4-amino-4-deoxy-L-arabinose transferase-like glycosyltransferase
MFGYRKNLLLLIIISTALRLVTAASVELGNDEVYYWTYAQKLQWNYFDHPPMVAVWIRFFTANLSLQQYELFIRLGSVLSCAVATMILFHTVRKLHSEKAGWYVAMLYNASLYAGMIAGIFIMPDSPQMLFWCGCLWLLTKIFESPRNTVTWLMFGLCAGLCILSKIHAVFIWFGLGLFILVKKREWLKLPQLYLALFITAALASPILIWNMANDFITYRFHSERVEVEKFQVNWTGLAREIFGQIFYNNPFNVFISIVALAMAGKKFSLQKPVLSIYNFIALPMVVVLIVIAVFRNTFPHWSGPAYVTLLPLASIYLAEKKSPIIARRAIGFAAFIMVAGLLLINFYPGTLGAKTVEKRGTGDFTLDMYGWGMAGKSFAIIREKEIKSHRIDSKAPLVTYKWFPAAHEDYYFCRPLGIEMIGLGNIHDLHHYSWMNSWRMRNADPEKAWCIIPSNEKFDPAEKFSDYYTGIDFVTTIIESRNGKTARNFYVYILTGKKPALTNLNPQK